jgi:tRNA A-37 threonylcarbamoyl transferase component Bud32
MAVDVTDALRAAVAGDLPLRAVGRDAEVFDLDGRSVVRVYRDRHRSAITEARAMEHARAFGVPAPDVLGSSGPAIVMEAVSGPLLLEEAGRRPSRLRPMIEALLSLHCSLDAVPAPMWLPPAFGGGSGVAHLDLHPANVVLTPDGPVLLDWTNVARADRLVDLAQTWLILGSSSHELPGAGAPPALSLASQMAASVFRRSAGEAPVEAVLAKVAARRLRDPNVPAHERARVRRFLASVARPAGRRRYRSVHTPRSRDNT